MGKPSGKRNRKKKFKKVNKEKFIKVHCGNCPSFVNEKDVEIDKIEGEVLTFICPNCNATQKSIRF